MKIKVREGQTLFDLSIQHYGSIEGVWQILEDNSLSLESEIFPGQELEIRDGVINEQAIYFRRARKEINNSDTVRQSDKLPLSILVTKVQNEVKGGDGFVLVEIIGGKAPYGFLWSNGSTTKDLINVSAGTYTLTVEDAKGQTSTLEISIGTSNTLFF